MTRHAEDFEREVIGRVPAKVLNVTWSVASTTRLTIGASPVIVRQLIGHADNSLCPKITVDIKMAVVTPARETGRCL
jgi:hypothetical protein